tara:strand:- start:1974 stop:2681 length:708 start_codon:yes stop_codon:yes gene_type:complete
LVEIADINVLAPSTVHRLLSLLEVQSFLSVDTETGPWQIGVSGFRIGNAFVRFRDFVGQIRPLTIGLSDHTGETVNLATLAGNRALFVLQMESENTVRKVAPLISLSLLHASDTGKVLLSVPNAEECSQLMEQLAYDALTDNTPQSKSSLTKDIERIIEEGRFYDREAHVEGMQCVTAPVFDELCAPTCMLGISGPMVRITEEVLVGHGDAVAQTANQVTQLLGGISPSQRSAHD